jgi:endonuclease-3
MTSTLRRSCRNRRPSTAESPQADNVASSAMIASPVPSSNKRIKLESSPHAARPDPAPSSYSATVVVTKKTTSRRPTPEECAYAVQELGNLHPDVLQDTKGRREQFSSCGQQSDILDGVVSTMLSQNTTNANSTRAFANLKKDFSTWQKVVDLETPEKLEKAIHCGGLAKIKAQRILNLCRTLQEERGSPPSFEYLRDWSNNQIQQELTRFPGLGKKTISCVLLFTLGREEFPVDTHVYRIAKQVKWIPSGFSRDAAYDYLNTVVPPPLKLNLHCLLIAHGRQCHRCAARGKPQFPPSDGSKLNCPLVNLDTKTFVVETKILVKKIKQQE